ncbi:UvrD-helicase domain-containing protein [Candidatus Curtissbacteria bacterium]|nr:UvrD-helicase domain-containing protein [Candidatus Curtissbacteria bacterium]
MSGILKDLNSEQREAATTTEGPLLIIAGAGTGKTAVIARRIAYIIEKKLAKPSEILALTFTDKSASEMEERVDILVPYGFIDTWISTFHAFGDRILRDNAFDIGLSPDFKVLSHPQQVLFFQQNLFRIPLDYWRPLSNPTKFISAILSFFSRLKDENVLPKEFSLYAKKSQPKAGRPLDEKVEAKKYQELATAYEAYEKFKDEAGVLDFGDQVIKTIQLFTKRPKILESYQQKFKYILVDEYQDTNYAQNELVKILASSHKNICVVGDDDQSIYKFRGAAISNIMEFKKTYQRAKQVVLTQNFRSTQSILDSAYRLIRHNDPDRLEVQNKIDKKLKSVGGQGLPPQEIFADTISEEADLVAAEIEKLMSKQTANRKQLTAVSRKRYAYKDFAILVRANSQVDHFLRALNMKGIPHKFVGSSGLYRQEEVSILIALLKSITDFEDSMSLFHLATSEVYGLPTKEALKLTSYAQRKNRALFYILENLEQPARDGVEISEEAGAAIAKLMEDLHFLINLAREKDAGSVLYAFLFERTKYIEKLSNDNDVESQVKIQNIAKFFEKVREFTDVVKLGNTLQFVNYLESLREVGDDPATVEFDPDLDAVNVMTVHGAKGLEFPVVFLVGLVADRFPTRARKEAIEVPPNLIRETLPTGDWHLQEERRLFYVGATRARDLLYFSWSRDIGGARAKKISPFVLEALDKSKSDAALKKLSPLEKIEKFAPTPQRATQTMLIDTKGVKLSRLALDDYETCHYKYRFVHVLRVPIRPHHTMTFGNAIHSAIAALLVSKQNGKPISLANMLEVFENSWSGEGFTSIDHEEKRKNEGKIALKSFYQREIKNPQKPTYVETPFRFGVGDIIVTGRYDRVDVLPGSKITIIDYKTSENVDQTKANQRAKDSNQLAIYALSYYKKYEIIPEKVALNFVDTGIEGAYVPTIKDLAKTEQKIIELAEGIVRDTQNDTFIANPKYFGSEPACNYCSYSAICPFSLAKI